MTWYLGQVAIAAGLVDHHQLAAVRRAPDKHRRHIRRPRGGVDADMQQLNPGPGQQRHDRAGVPRHIGHLCGDRCAPKAPIQLGREAQANVEERLVHQLGVGGEWQRVPDDIAGRDARLDLAAPSRVGPLQRLVDQPGAGRPDKAIGAALAQRLGGRQRLRDKLAKIAGGDVAGVVGEANVEVGLKNEVDG